MHGYKSGEMNKRKSMDVRKLGKTTTSKWGLPCTT